MRRIVVDNWYTIVYNLVMINAISGTNKTKFLTVRDLRSSFANVWDSLSKNGELVITNNGRPTAILLDVVDDDFEETLRMIRQAKVMRAFNNMRIIAANEGFMSDEDIETEIAEARKDNPKCKR